MRIAYKTDKGVFYHGSVEEALKSNKFKKYKNRVSLLLTSPPFPLNRKKKYGNLQGTEYTKWLSDLAILFKDYLKKNGSIVIEVGNSWEPGLPVMSTLALKSLLAFLEKGGFYLCQQFIWYNSAKLPTPAQWVNVDRCRVKDSFTHIWWMSKTPKPKANNKRVLKEYSKSMKKLLKNQDYNSGKRPSEHHIGAESFLKRNKGAIPSNVLISSNTSPNSRYQQYCRKKELVPHPARMPIDIPKFFIKFLTNKNDLVWDPFAGSNTTGEAAQSLERKWLATETNIDYIKGSKGRFLKKI